VTSLIISDSICVEVAQRDTVTRLEFVYSAYKDVHAALADYRAAHQSMSRRILQVAIAPLGLERPRSDVPVVCFPRRPSAASVVCCKRSPDFDDKAASLSLHLTGEPR